MPVRAKPFWALFGLVCVLCLTGADRPPQARGQQEELPNPRPVPGAPAVRCPAPPPWLPRYDLDMQLDLDNHRVYVRQRVGWINRHARPAESLVFNAHSHYQVPAKEIGLLAKTLEIMRVMPSDALPDGPPPLEVQKVLLGGAELKFRYLEDNPTALEVALPKPAGHGEVVEIEIQFVLNLPHKLGRWGYWEGVTFLSNWLPVLAFYDDKGWQPTPFVPWHQPFFNEAGVYRANVVLPCDQKIACSGSIVAEHKLDGGFKQVEILANGVRDFAFLCSARFQEFTGEVEAAPGVNPVRIHCLAFPEHEFYARKLVKIACDVIPVYSKWFGPYPWSDFTFAESYFGWNGNECATLVMVDERVLGMPHLAEGYVDYLISHEVCHQWWYNLIGTNGYCETWMDEAFANYFAHRHLNICRGHNNTLLSYPSGLEWLPNIKRENYRYYGLYGTLGRGEGCPAVQEMPKFGHVMNLFSMAYDKGGKVLGMIEDRLGEAAFIDFIRGIYCKYAYKIIRVADFQRELEAYTGQSWEEFFHRWLYGSGSSDWAVEKVDLKGCKRKGIFGTSFLQALHGSDEPCACKVRVHLHQRSDYCEQTVLGIALHDDKKYDIRIPIMPQVGVLELPEFQARVETLTDNRVVVEVDLPCRPEQITVDPDQVLVDCNPANNYWKHPFRYRFTGLYTFLEETDITNDYDRWNVICGPWVYTAGFNDPWYTRSTMVGLRAGTYRTQEFNGGFYLGYRTDYRDVVAGVDGFIDHWPYCKMQVGFSAEHRLVTFQDGENRVDRAALWARYVFQYSSCLYQPPMHYLEGFTTFQDNFLPFARNPEPGGVRWDNFEAAGLHYHINYLTPYWDAEGGFQLDATYQGGAVDLGPTMGLHEAFGQLSWAKYVPDLSGHVEGKTGLDWLKCPLHWLGTTRLAFRGYGAIGLPLRGEFFSLGGSQQFRGFDLRERQGSGIWIGSVEWRVPIATHLEWDCCDHVFGLRNAYAALFYDIGDAYVNGGSIGPVAHAVGAGLRLDMSVLGFVERAVLRFDMAQAIGAGTPMQFWFGVQQPF